ncbi:hypothetical protein HYQ46_004013 [Verticillium longisporum]|nr:hypothetical protein HYQ46_004013 [Verticillium longisporum]
MLVRELDAEKAVRDVLVLSYHAIAGFDARRTQVDGRGRDDDFSNNGAVVRHHRAGVVAVGFMTLKDVHRSLDGLASVGEVFQYPFGAVLLKTSQTI